MMRNPLNIKSQGNEKFELSSQGNGDSQNLRYETLITGHKAEVRINGKGNKVAPHVHLASNQKRDEKIQENIEDSNLFKELTSPGSIKFISEVLRTAFRVSIV